MLEQSDYSWDLIPLPGHRAGVRNTIVGYFIQGEALSSTVGPEKLCMLLHMGQ